MRRRRIIFAALILLSAFLTTGCQNTSAEKDILWYQKYPAEMTLKFTDGENISLKLNLGAQSADSNLRDESVFFVIEPSSLEGICFSISENSSYSFHDNVKIPISSETDNRLRLIISSFQLDKSNLIKMETVNDNGKVYTLAEFDYGENKYQILLNSDGYPSHITAKSSNFSIDAEVEGFKKK